MTDGPESTATPAPPNPPVHAGPVPPAPTEAAPPQEVVSDDLPSGFECPGCLYDMSGLATRVCPECGRAVSLGDFEAIRERANARDRVGGLLVAQLVFAAAVCAVYGAGGGLASGELGEVALAAIPCGLALAGSTLTGFVASRFTRPVDRPVWFAAWLRTHLWLHAPWLVAPVTGAILLVAGTWNALLDAAVLGLIVWIVGVIATLWTWGLKIAAQRRRLGLRAITPLVIAAVFIFLAASFQGFLSGVYAFGLVVRMGLAPGIGP